MLSYRSAVSLPGCESGVSFRRRSMPEAWHPIFDCGACLSRWGNCWRARDLLRGSGCIRRTRCPHLPPDGWPRNRSLHAALRASRLEALGKVKPDVAAVIGTSPAGAIARSVDTSMVATTQPYACRKCSNELVGEEQFCGKCGSPRISDSGPPSMQSKVASLRRVQEADSETIPTPANGTGHSPVTPESLEHGFPQDSEEEHAEPNADEVLQQLIASKARRPLEKTDDPLGGVKLQAEENAEA